MQVLLDVECHLTGPFQENSYVLKCPASRRFAVVDPGLDIANRCRELIALGWEMERVLLTHAHLDHVWGLPALLRVREVPFHLHPADLPLFHGIPLQAQMFSVPNVEPMPAPDPAHYIQTGDTVRVGEAELFVFHTPGHAPGHVCFYWGEASPSMPRETGHREADAEAELSVANAQADGDCLVGDLVICGSTGRTDLPGGDFRALLHSIQRRLFRLPANTRLYPGHCGESSVGHEIATNSVVGRGAPYFSAAAE